MSASKEYSVYKANRDRFMYNLAKQYDFITCKDLGEWFNLRAAYVREILRGIDKKLEVKISPSSAEDTDSRKLKIQKLYYDYILELLNTYGYNDLTPYMEVFGDTTTWDSIINLHIEALNFQVAYFKNEGMGYYRENQQLKREYTKLTNEYNALKSRPVTQVQEVHVEDTETLRKVYSKYKELESEHKILKYKYEELLTHTNIYATKEQDSKIKQLEHDNTVLNDSIREIKEDNKKLSSNNLKLVEERGCLETEKIELLNTIEELENSLALSTARETTLNDLLNDKEKEFKHLSTANKELEKELNNFKSLYKEASALVRQLTAQVEELSLNSGGLEFELEESENELQLYKQELEKSKEEVKQLKEKKSKPKAKKSFQQGLSDEVKDAIVQWSTSHNGRLTKKSLEEFNKKYGLNLCDSTFRYVANTWPEQKRHKEAMQVVSQPKKKSTKKEPNKTKG